VYIYAKNSILVQINIIRDLIEIFVNTHVAQHSKSETKSLVAGQGFCASVSPSSLMDLDFPELRLGVHWVSLDVIQVQM